MLNSSPINLKVCGITSSKSIKIAAQKNIKTLGFASNNLLGPNTCNDEILKEMNKKVELEGDLGASDSKFLFYLSLTFIRKTQ